MDKILPRLLKNNVHCIIRHLVQNTSNYEMGRGDCPPDPFLTYKTPTPLPNPTVYCDCFFQRKALLILLVLLLLRQLG